MPLAKIYQDPYDVDLRLAELRLPRDLIVLAASNGDIDRRFVSPLDFPGRDEYDAASTALRTICERGGSTPGGWHRGKLLKVPVAFNTEETVAIAVTGGGGAVGRVSDDDPRNRSLKGPNTERLAALPLPFGLDDETESGVDFWYMLTVREGDDLWCELSCPLLVEGGMVIGWRERILIGLIKPHPLPARLGQPIAPAAPTSAPDIKVERRGA